MSLQTVSDYRMQSSQVIGSIHWGERGECDQMTRFYANMGFFRLQTSYSNLPKQVDILSPSIQIVFQNIENSSNHEHVNIGLNSKNCKFPTNFF